MKRFNLPLECFIAFRYLKTKQIGNFTTIMTWTSFLGITIGVFSLVLVMSVINGFRVELLERFLNAQSHGVVAFSPKLDDRQELIKRLKKIDGVKNVVEVMQGYTVLFADNQVQPLLVRGGRFHEPSEIPVYGVLIEGDISNLLEGHNIEENNNVVIGNGIAKRYGLRVGSDITFMSFSEGDMGFSSTPSFENYNVSAIFKHGVGEYDSNVIWTDINGFKNLVVQAVDRAQVEITVVDPDNMDQINVDILKVLENKGKFFDWITLNPELKNALGIERKVMSVVLGLILLVAGLNIISSLVMLVKDKTRDVVILRSMGITKGGILRVFLIAGTSIGVIGAVVGALLGCLAAEHIETIRQNLLAITGDEVFTTKAVLLDYIPSKLIPEQVLMIMFMSIGLAFLATVYPAWRAASLQIVDGLRNE